MGPQTVLISFVLATAAVFVWALTLRYRQRELLHRERLAAIEKGIALTDLPNMDRLDASSRIYLLRGMIWLFTGIFLTLFLVAVSITTAQPKSLNRRLSEAQQAQSLGASPEQIQQIQNDVTKQVGLPVGFSLLGLVPLGVGLAYLIFYYTETKHVSAR
jgi:hypothetical protein